MQKLYRYIYFCTFLLYIPLVIVITFFYPRRERIVKTYEYHFIPFQSTIAQFKDPQQYNTPGYWRVVATGITGNLLLFFPLGYFLKFFTRRKNSIIFLYAVAVSVAIELTQLVSHLGVCDIDDVILNSIGAWAGISICNIIHKTYFNHSSVNLLQH